MLAKNKKVDYLNATVQNLLPKMLYSFKSVDTIINQDDVDKYPTESAIGNSMDYRLTISYDKEIQVPILHNMNQPLLYNLNKTCWEKANEYRQRSSRENTKQNLILRILMVATNFPFNFKRLQLPVCLAFTKTINKSQGQSLVVYWMNCKFPCFVHYVVCTPI